MNKKLLNCLTDVGLTEVIYEKYREFPSNGLSETQLTGKILFEYLDHLKKKDRDIPYHNFSMSFFTIALMELENENPFFNFAYESRRCKLLDYQQSGVVTKVQILTAGEKSCENCRELDGRILPIDVALMTMPIPCKNCVHWVTEVTEIGWCRCVYSPIVDDE